MRIGIKGGKKGKQFKASEWNKWNILEVLLERKVTDGIWKFITEKLKILGRQTQKQILR